MTELDLPTRYRPQTAPESGRWLQYNLEIDRATAPLYAALRDHAEATSGDWFFVHKPPGLRLRYRLAERSAVEPFLDRLVADGFAAGWRPAVYEPEQRLFGGAVSMRSVHRVFTADSRAWLAYHATVEPGSPLTALTFSLLTVRGLLDALEIAGWEDLDVWDRLARDGGRELAAAVVRDPRVERVVAVLRAGWADPAVLRRRLPGALLPAVDRYVAAVRAEAPRWIADYFTAPGAEVGPRQVSALLVIFHWNRGRLPLHQQALVTHALGCRRVVVP